MTGIPSSTTWLHSFWRRRFRSALEFDDATWARARGWVVEQAVFSIPYYATSLPVAVDQAMKRLSESLLPEQLHA